MRVAIRQAIVCTASLVLCACAGGIPPAALRLPVDASSTRELQSRRYEGVSEEILLVAAANQLQDLGFNLDESETRLGLIVASKERSAINNREVAAAVLMSVLSVLAAIPTEPVYAKRQRVRVSLVTYPEPPATDAPAVVGVRVTFQRTVFSNQGDLYSLEEVSDAEVYREFFARLDQSVFIEKETP